MLIDRDSGKETGSKNNDLFDGDERKITDHWNPFVYFLSSCRSMTEATQGIHCDQLLGDIAAE